MTTLLELAKCLDEARDEIRNMNYQEKVVLGDDRFIYIVSDEAAPGDICNLYHKGKPGMYYLKKNAQANAERIVACVNALDGISNEALEAGVVGEMVNTFKKINEKEEFAGTGIGNVAITILNKLEIKP